MSLPKPNPVEPPWYGPVCPVVWEGWHREVSPYPDQSADYRANTKIKAAPTTINALAVIISGTVRFGFDAGGMIVRGRYSL